MSTVRELQIDVARPSERLSRDKATRATGGKGLDRAVLEKDLARTVANEELIPRQ